MRTSTFLIVSLAAAACGGDDDYDYLPPDNRPPDAGPTPDSGDGPDMATGDGLAPLITLVSPEEGALVGGTITLAVDVSDADGIDTVTATSAGADPVTLNHGSGTRWTGTYDTRSLPGTVPTIVVRARDRSGAESQLGFQITLDNVAPWVSLDPPNVRESKLVDDQLQCSRSFDPLGGDAPNDGESVAQHIELRARVVDLGNTGTQSTTVLIPNAGVENAVMYVVDDSSVALVVDGDGDGFCDRINPDIDPDISTGVVVVDLAAVPASGAPPSGDVDAVAGGNASECAATYTSSGTQLCETEPEMTYAIATTFDGRPQIYGIAPVNAGSCAGYFFDAVATTIADGWACVAVVATDGLGNSSVSPPLRICIDHEPDGAEGCPAWGEISPEDVRPACTDGCTMRPGIDTFPDTGVIGDYELVRKSM